MINLNFVISFYIYIYIYEYDKRPITWIRSNDTFALIIISLWYYLTHKKRGCCVFFTRIKHSLLFFTYNPGSVSYLLQSVLLLPRWTICSIFVILVQPFWSNKPPLPYSLHQITKNDLKLEPWWLVFWDPKWVYCESCADTLKEKNAYYASEGSTTISEVV